MNRDLSLRGILTEWVREVVGIEGRLPRTFGKLFAHPGFLTRATLDGERDAYLSALKLFLVANLVVFLGIYVPDYPDGSPARARSGTSARSRDATFRVDLPDGDVRWDGVKMCGGSA